jgi:hypothetical protein
MKRERRGKGEEPRGADLAALSILAYAQGFTLWHYRAGGGLAETLGPGFFAPAARLFETGDMVLVSARDGGGLFLVCDKRKPTLAPVLGALPEAAPLSRTAPPAPRRRSPLRAVLRGGP